MVLARYDSDMQPTGGDLFTDKMEVNLNMFHPSVEEYQIVDVS